MVGHLHFVLLPIAPLAYLAVLVGAVAVDSVQRAAHRDAVDPGAEVGA